MIEVRKPRPNNINGLEDEFNESAISQEHVKMAQEFIDENPILRQVIDFNEEQYGNKTIREALERMKDDEDFLKRLKGQSDKEVGEQLKEIREVIVQASPGDEEIKKVDKPLAKVIENFEDEKSGVKTRSLEETNVSDLISQRLTAIETTANYLETAEERGLLEGEEGAEKKEKSLRILKKEQEKLATILVAIKRAA